MPAADLTTLLLLIPLFAALWLGISLLKARVTGWSRLAKRWARPASELPEGQLSSCSMGWGGYRVLHLGGTPEGLVLRASFTDTLGHPALLIPWERVEELGPGRPFPRAMIRLSLDGVSAEFPEDSYLQALDHEGSD